MTSPNGLQFQRTGLAWQRTSFTLLAVAALSLRSWGASLSWSDVLGALAMVGTVVLLAHVVERRHNRPDPNAQHSVVVVSALVTLAIAALGVLSIVVLLSSP